MRFLITGDAGFLGQALTRELVDHDHDVVGYDIARGPGEDVCSKVSFGMALACHSPDVVVHMAASVGRINCELYPSEALHTNVMGTRNVAQMCTKHGVPLVFVSSSEVYGDHGDQWVDESDCTEMPSSGIYALSKRTGEGVCETYAPDGLKIIRPTMPYGPGVPPGPGRRALDNLVWQALTGQKMVVHRGAARSWCWIDDVASAMRYVITHGKEGIYNVGRDDDEVSMEALAIWICDYLEVDDSKLIEIVDPPALQTVVKRIHCDKIKHLGWAPEVNLDVGLPKMIEWVRAWLAIQDSPATD